MMSDSWKEVPDERPTFGQLIIQLEEMMSKDSTYFDFDFFVAETDFNILMCFVDSEWSN